MNRGQLSHQRMLAGELNPTHGTASTYRSYMCRCDPCTEAHTIRKHAEIALRAARRDQADFEHGASAYTNWLCRCEVCTAANSRKSADRLRRIRSEATP